MKNQVYIILIVIIIFLSIVIFSIQILNSKKLIYFEKDIKNFDRLISIDQFTESLIKSSLIEISISASLKSSKNSFGRSLWDSYPRCLSSYIPSVNEVKQNIEDEILKNLKNFKNLIYLLNALLFFYPTKIFIKIDNVKIFLPFTDIDVLSGKLDNGFPTNFNDIEVEISFPHGISKKNYRVTVDTGNLRLFYIYRLINNWITSKKYQDIVSKYSKDLFTCFLGYTVTNNYNYQCESQKKEICEGELIRKILEERIEKIPVKICTEEEKLKIEKNNALVSSTCIPGKIKESLDCKILNCIVTYKEDLVRKKENFKKDLSFAVGGSDTSFPSGGGSDVCPYPEIVEKYECREVLIREDYLGQKCITQKTIRDKYSPLDIMICSTSINCPSNNQIFSIIKTIKEEVEKELNNLFLPDDNIICKVDISVFEYKCENLVIKDVNEIECFCLVKEGTKSSIKVIYNVSCIDNKYYQFVNNKLENLEIRFNLGIYGQSVCNPSNVYVDKSIINSFCCKIENIGPSKDCCSGIDINGNCIVCPPIDVSSNIAKIDSILCVS